MKIRTGKYRHYKGKLYEVLGVALHEETLEKLVVYRALYGRRQLWARPLNVFIGKVIVNGSKMPRFRRIGSKSGSTERKIKRKNRNRK